MRTETVEIYSDATNSAVMKHPERRFPGVLIQGDTLYSLCVDADAACKAGRGSMNHDAYADLNKLRNHLWDFLNQYKCVLAEHQIPLPFNETPNV